MSFSFSITAATKTEAGAAVKAELAKAVSAQPAHEADQQAALDAAEAFIQVLAEPGEGECIYVSVSGSLSWREEKAFTGAQFSIAASVG